MNKGHGKRQVWQTTVLIALFIGVGSARSSAQDNHEDFIEAKRDHASEADLALTPIPIPSDKEKYPAGYYDSFLQSLRQQEAELAKSDLSHSRRSMHLWNRFLGYFKMLTDEPNQLLAVFMDAYRHDKHSFCAEYAEWIPRLTDGQFSYCLDHYPFEKPVMDELVRLVLESYDHELVAKLADIKISDQRIRSTITPEMDAKEAKDLLAQQRKIDLANLKTIETIMAQQGYPGRSAVGVQYEEVAFLVIQHCGGEAIGKHLPAIEKAIENRDLKASVYPYLYDRYEVENGRPQRFGTQSKIDSGELFPLQDPEQVNAFRRQYGLQPLPAQNDQ